MLELKSITKDYILSDTKVNALKGISVDFREHEFVAILGPSGCGKTTLLNIVGGLDSYTDGDLVIDGISTKEFKSRDWDTYRNQRIGFVFQNYNLIPHLSVLSNVELALTISGVGRKDKRRMSLEALEKVGLSEQVNKRPLQMSGGQMQRVAIARAIVNNPDIILADEPTGALDSQTSVQVMDILKEISKDRLVIVVTHNPELAQKYATRTITLLDGEVTSDSNPVSEEELKALKEKATNPDMTAESTAVCEADITDGTGAQVNFDETADVVKCEKTNDGAVSADANATDKKIKRYKKKSSMSFFTSLALSAKNLVTKKLRTALTVFAGSIGIIGIALVLSISNGFSLYMDDLEKTTLSSFPITISDIAISYDMNEAAETGLGSGTFPSSDTVKPYDPSGTAGLEISSNILTDEYFNYIKKMEEDHPDWAASVAYERKVSMHLIAKNENTSDPYILVDNESNEMTGSFWQELLADDFVNGYYDVLAGRYPQNEFELVLIVDSNNRIKTDTLKALGYSVTAVSSAQGEAVEYKDIDFTKFIGNSSGEGAKEFKLVLNDEYYAKNGDYFTELAKSSYESVFNSDGDRLKIVGILRIKQDSDLSFFGSGIGYLPSLTEYVLNSSVNSEIVTAQTGSYADMLSPTSDEFSFNFDSLDKLLIMSNLKISQVALMLAQPKVGILTDEQAMSIASNPDASFADIFNAVKTNEGSTEGAINRLSDYLFENFGIEKSMLLQMVCPDYVERMQQIGAVTTPSSISIYPSTYENKQKIIKYLDAYNEGRTEMEQIHYTDLASTITDNMSEMINIVSYVLIAFAAISLVVSSIMIAIITYISVLERTKEIGVLRSLGARKIDISNVFNAETFIIGGASGIFGVCVAALLNLPINAIINNLVGGMVGNLAKLAPLHGILLVVLSIALNVIAGLIPAFIASKKDPVEALRSN